ncbi:hypothetical protein ACH5RR_039316 [Cinchona calisaya]|uniref:RNase H type-1 domain-containing protein n=1 Tax=Cinchona calisaya TaxID=153742 RepID=A0ABD2Y3I1_9GENT
MKALLDGIQLCHKLNIHNVIIEVDFKMVIGLLDNKFKHPWWLDRTFQLKMAKGGMNYSIVHVFKKGNRLTDFLANVGCDSKCNVIYDHTTLPNYARCIIRLDKNGLCKF